MTCVVHDPYTRSVIIESLYAGKPRGGTIRIMEYTHYDSCFFCLYTITCLSKSERSVVYMLSLLPARPFLTHCKMADLYILFKSGVVITTGRTKVRCVYYINFV